MILRRVAPVLAAVLVGVSQPAWADDSMFSKLVAGVDQSSFNEEVQKAVDILSNESETADFSKAIKILTEEGEKGNANAQYLLGKIYKRGAYGAEKDLTKAINWMNKASENGIPRAQALMSQIYFQNPKYKNPPKALELAKKSSVGGDKLGQLALGLIYITGAPAMDKKFPEKKIPIDAEKALFWFEKSANQGVGPAMGMMATAYYYGAPGVERDFGKAVKYARQGVEKSDFNSCLVLAKASYLGRGLEENKEQALQLLKRSAEIDKNSKVPREILGNMYLLGRGVKANPKEAFKWFDQARALGSVEGTLQTANMYLLGRGVEKDEQLGGKLLKQAASKGHPMAQHDLALRYIKGNGLPKDVEKGLSLLEAIATKKSYEDRLDVFGRTISGATIDQMKGRFDVLAAYHLALLYRDGVGVEQDFTSAKKWFEKASESGQFLSIANLGAMYLNGWGCEKDPKKSFELSLKAAKGGVNFAQYNLSKLYRRGLGTEANQEKASYWLEKAADNGMVKAQRQLGQNYLVGLYAERNPEKGFKYLKQAYEAGDEIAKVDYAVCCLKGIGTDKNVDKGINLLEEIVSKPYKPNKNPSKRLFAYNDGNSIERVEIDDYCADALASYNLAMIYKNGTEVKVDYAKAEHYLERAIKSGHSLAMAVLAALYLDRRENLERAVELTKNAANRGVSFALYNMYKIRILGTDGKKDKAKAIVWLKKAADKGHSKSMRILALGYLSGEIPDSDKTIGLKYLEKAAKAGDKTAKYRLGSMLCFGYKDKVPVDVKRGREILLEIVESPYKPIDNPRAKTINYFENGKKEVVVIEDYRPSGMAAFTLAMSYKDNKDGNADFKKAFRYFEIASHYGNSLAKSNLSVLYLQGRGVEKNIDKGISLAKSAAEKGVSTAQYNLGYSYEIGSGVEKNLAKAKDWYSKAAKNGHLKAKSALTRLDKESVQEKPIEAVTSGQ